MYVLEPPSSSAPEGMGPYQDGGLARQLMGHTEDSASMSLPHTDTVRGPNRAGAGEACV